MVAISTLLCQVAPHNIRFVKQDDSPVNLAQTLKKKKFHLPPPYTRGYPGSFNPFFYDSGEDDDNPQTDWTFIWFYILLFMSIYIIVTVVLAFVFSDVLTVEYAEKRAEEKKA